MKHAAIIGGGLGGLGLAVRLAARGARVSVFEQARRLGGKMNRFERSGFTFDTGPSLITMPAAFEELFAAAGHRLQEHVQLQRLEPVAEYVFADGTRFLHTTSLPGWLETIRTLEPRDVDGFLRLLRLGARIFKLSEATFLRAPPGSPPDPQAIKALRFMPLRHAWGNYDAAVRAHLKSPYLVQLLNRFPTYVGSSPYQCPATLLVIPFIEFAFGAWFAMGGLYNIVLALESVARDLGVEFHLESRVDRILHDHSRVTGVRLGDGSAIAADVVAMNGDASALPALLNGPDAAAGLPPARRSLSGFVTLAGVAHDLPGLRHHSVFFSADYPNEFRQLFHEAKFPDDPTVYVNAPSRSDRTLVPGTGETLFIMANAPARSENWSAESSREARRNVFRRLHASGFPELGGSTTVLEEISPQDLESRYAMPGGAIYGTVSHGWRGAFLRPPNRQKPRGLYLVGGSGHPGGGTPTVLISSRITADLIARHDHF